MQFLYQLDLRGQEIMSQLEPFLAESREDSDEGLFWQNYARELIAGAIAHWQELDDKIKKIAKNWDISRMAVVDRTILRIAMYELCYNPATPPKVAINEAIELGKKFSTENSGAFINGILDNFLKTSNLMKDKEHEPAIAKEQEPAIAKEQEPKT